MSSPVSKKNLPQAAELRRVAVRTVQWFDRESPRALYNGPCRCDGCVVCWLRGQLDRLVRVSMQLLVRALKRAFFPNGRLRDRASLCCKPGKLDICARCDVYWALLAWDRVQHKTPADGNGPRRRRIEVGKPCKRGHMIRSPDDYHERLDHRGWRRRECRHCWQEDNAARYWATYVHKRIPGFCRKGLHDLNDPKNVRLGSDGRRRCEPCRVDTNQTREALRKRNGQKARRLRVRSRPAPCRGEAAELRTDSQVR